MRNRLDNQAKQQEIRGLIRAGERGMTLIEIMIVVIIMAMIATGVGVAVLPQLDKARIKEARADVAAIRTAVQLYLAESPGRCPTVEDLKEDRLLDKGKRTTDPWDKEFVINCIDGEDPEVFSTGPDFQEGGCDPGRGVDDGCDEK
jgi:general secretion pathway protein G